MSKKAFLFLATFLTVILLNAQWTQIGADFEGTEMSEELGHSVSINSDGSVIALGALTSSKGYVKILQNNSGIWNQIGEDIIGESSGDQSGYSVSLNADGTIVAIGAIDNDGNGSNSGQARIFQNVSNVWIQIGNDIDGDTAYDHFGFAVSLNADGTIVAISANENDNGGFKSGHVKVFRFVADDWEQIGEEIVGVSQNNEFGHSVSLSSNGETLAISSIKNGGNGTNAGHVRVFRNNLDNWEQIGEDIEGEISSDESGYSVSLSDDGSILAIGARKNDGNGNKSGHVRIYQNNAGVWEQLGNDIDGEAEEDYSGSAVSISGDGLTVAIGAPQNDGNGNASGHVRVFEFLDEAWVQKGMDIDGESEGNWSGRAVGLSADASTVIIGAPFCGDGEYKAGQARVYSFSDLTEINTNLLESNIQVSPNPTQNIVTVNVDQVRVNNLSISSSNGTILSQLSFADKINPHSSSQAIKLDLSDQIPGIYFIRLETDEQTIFKKIIKI